LIIALKDGCCGDHNRSHWNFDEFPEFQLGADYLVICPSIDMPEHLDIR
jgi:hypothetical protein